VQERKCFEATSPVDKDTSNLFEEHLISNTLVGAAAI